MASKLIQTASYKAEYRIEASPREAFLLIELRIPFLLNTLILIEQLFMEFYVNPHLAEVHINHLHGKISDDGYSFFMNTLIMVVNDLYLKLFGYAKGAIDLG
ncbi:hypothetical protein ACSBR2_040925 [Camellia fascicularis]